MPYYSMFSWFSFSTVRISEAQKSSLNTCLLHGQSPVDLKPFSAISIRNDLVYAIPNISEIAVCFMVLPGFVLNQTDDASL